MERTTKAIVLFGLVAALAALIVVLYFWDLFGQQTTLGAVYWAATPLIAGVVAAGIANAILRSLKVQRMGPIFGGIVALLSLTACTFYVCLPAIGNGFLEFFPLMLQYALLLVGWFAVILGAVAGLGVPPLCLVQALTRRSTGRCPACVLRRPPAAPVG